MSKKTVNSRNISQEVAIIEELASHIRDVFVKEYREYVVAKFLPKKESKDEEIRQELIKFLNDCYNIDSGFFTRYCKIPFKQMLSWIEKQGEPTDINPSEFDLQLNRLLKQFETLPKEELVNSLSFYLNVVQNNGTYKSDKKQSEPELKDNEDERIRQELITFVIGSIQDEESEQRKTYLTWLEKQGENNWKPSDKQMEAVKKAFRELFSRDLVDEDFLSLINDLNDL